MTWILFCCVTIAEVLGIITINTRNVLAEVAGGIHRQSVLRSILLSVDLRGGPDDRNPRKPSLCRSYCVRWGFCACFGINPDLLWYLHRLEPMSSPRISVGWAGPATILWAGGLRSTIILFGLPTSEWTPRQLHGSSASGRRPLHSRRRLF